MAKYICTNCGTVGKGRNHTEGSLVIEILLWLLLFVPGIFYSAYRIASRHLICRYCESDQLVDIKTPYGKQLVADWEIYRKQNPQYKTL